MLKAGSPTLSRLTWVVGLEPRKMGGFERMCIEVARVARERGVQVDFIFECEPCPALAVALNEHAASWHVIPRLGELGLQQTIALALHLRRSKPDLVHLHFCAFYGPFFLLAKWLGIPLIGTYHLSGAPAPSKGVLRFLKLRRLHRFSGSLASVTAVSESARRKFLTDYLESPAKVSIIYNGIARVPPPEESDRPLNLVGLPSGSPRVIFVGALTREKGVHIGLGALAAARRGLPKVTLTIVGEGPEEVNLRQLAGELGVADAVSFLGVRDDVAELFAHHDIAIVPSIWQEAFGFVVLEAMAANCPIIASNVGGISEIVHDGVEGILVPPADAALLADALIRLWNSPRERAQLIARAHARIDSTFSVGQIVSQYWEMYDRTVDQGA